MKATTLGSRSPSTSKRITVMISSRNNDEIVWGGAKRTLSELRTEIKRQIEEIRIAGRQLFSCWINELAPAAAADTSAWEECMEQARSADAFIALYNGNAGWGRPGSALGICHAELQEALNAGRARVRVVKLPGSNALRKRSTRDEQFRQFIEEKSTPMWGMQPKNGDETIEAVIAALHDSVVDLIVRGGKSSARGRADVGAPLDWTRMSFAARRNAMIDALREGLKQRAEAAFRGDRARLLLRLDGKRVMVCLDAIPSALSVPEARELVGRPFLRDHELAAELKSCDGGPIHLIGVKKGVTERQATSMLGFPDATVVPSEFGVYVADDIQKIQLILIADCRDTKSTAYGLDRFFDWLDDAEEIPRLLSRSASRARIVQLVAEEAGL